MSGNDEALSLGNCPPAPVLTRAEAEQRLTDEVVMAVFELLDWDTRAWSCDQARAVLLAALFPEGGQCRVDKRRHGCYTW